MDKEQMQGEPTQDSSTLLENTRKSRDEFKKQVSILTSTVDAQAGHIEKQREQIDKLIDAICVLSKAVKR